MMRQIKNRRRCLTTIESLEPRQLLSSDVIGAIYATQVPPHVISETAVVTGSPQATSTTLQASAPNTTVDVPVVYSAAVFSVNGGAPPTGSVTFYYNYSLTNYGSQVVPLASDGIATFSIYSTALSYINVSATYSGDASNLTSNSSIVTVNCNTGPTTLKATRGTIPESIITSSTTRGTMEVSVTDTSDAPIREVETINMYSQVIATATNTLIGNEHQTINLLPGQTRTYPIHVNLSAADSVAGEDQFLFNVISKTSATSIGYGVYLKVAAAKDSLSESITKLDLATSLVAGGVVHGASATVSVTDNGNVSPPGLTTVKLIVSSDGNVADGYDLGTKTLRLGVKPGHSIPVVVPIKNIPDVAGASCSVFAEAIDSSSQVTSSAESALDAVTIAAPFVRLLVTGTLRPAIFSTKAVSYIYSITVTDTGNEDANGTIDLAGEGFNDAYPIGTLLETRGSSPAHIKAGKPEKFTVHGKYAGAGSFPVGVFNSELTALLNGASGVGEIDDAFTVTG